MKHSLLQIWFALIVGIVLGQVNVALAEPNHAPAVLISPEVHADHSVTFRIRSPATHSMLFKLEGWSAATAMDKDVDGVWTITTASLTPDYYVYAFFMDDVMLMDPSNTQIRPSLIAAQSEVHVVGAEPLPWEITDVPHGEVHHHFYTSAVAKDYRDYYVYTPPAYDPKSTKTYPVLYLLHGFGDDANAWLAVGRVNAILDNLIAQRKAKPMIVVMPLGYGTMEMVRHGWSPSDELNDRNLTGFHDALLTEVMPRVEHQYSISKQRNAHAIAGLSMGGTESLLTGLNNRDKFAWIGSFSSGAIKGDFEHAFPALDSSVNRRLRLLWISCGIEDNLIAPNRDLLGWLRAKDVKVTSVETPGGHVWIVWRRNFVDFASLLFR